jgi:glycosidase
MDFHISHLARKRYELEDSLFSFRGNTIFANFHAARIFAQSMNNKRNLKVHPELTVQAGQVNAMGLIDEIMHVVIAQYRSQKASCLYEDLLSKLEKCIGKRKLDTTLRSFIREFPPVPVFHETLSVDDYLAGESEGISNRAAALEELLMLWLSSSNPASQPYNELFDDTSLRKSTSYLNVIDALHAYFDDQPFYGPDNQNLIDMLRAPAIAVPDSFKGQLEYIQSRWGNLLGHYLLKLLGSLNMISEEEQLRVLGPGPVRIPVYTSDSELENPRFSQDADWMPRLVMIAKNTYVWLDQLGKKYQRLISRLDQIPDEELDLLAERGFSGLWLIGLWERSRASARIKQLCGNPEAIASAYSLKEYKIADDLGGDGALQSLSERAWRRGIRLSSDMVPNHMAIDSNWVRDHPDWFISLPYSPFPSYSFNGINLSEEGRDAIQIEDHYFDRTDAAVVFKYQNQCNEKTYYIYHGNDGTSMPWNDTAQLNYLNPQVREAVIQAILEVARRFPIIRFDAAMTLAKRHYQRLWYPLPGGGCSIPSRSEFSMPQEQFNQLMPEEFWREVVDRVAIEAPDTLLLAEAFWLMEGYFVRTLGMHRVYNSAFMNLLRDEDNAKYRQVIKNTLEFDPEILKRFVNFMNNPDEHTAANQFGKGDKYFGICTLLATMPGLPMFGHGQVEGFTEKYGMEYKRAYLDEPIDQQLIDRHAWQIFPLLKNRYLFSNVDSFLFYDFINSEGQVDENVFAYSNSNGGQHSLVVYHNRFGDTSGWMKTSTAFMDKATGVLRHMELLKGLNLPDGKHQFVLFHDQLSGLEYIRNCAEIARKGIYIQLDAYRAHVFTDFRIEKDDETCILAQLHDHLNGRGTADFQELRWELPLRSILKPLREIANPGYFGFLLAQHPKAVGSKMPDFLLNEADHKLDNLIHGAENLLQMPLKIKESCGDFRKKTAMIYQLEWLDNILGDKLPQSLKQMIPWLREKSSGDIWLGIFCWVYLDCLRSSLGMPVDQFLELIAKWRFFGIIESALWDMGKQISSPGDLSRSIALLLRVNNWQTENARRGNGRIMRELLSDGFISDFLKVNDYGGKTWFGKESAETAFFLMAIAGLMEILTDSKQTHKRKLVRMEKLAGQLLSFKDAADSSGYNLNHFLDILDQA